MGTPTYTAPEIVSGGSDYGTQARDLDSCSRVLTVYSLPTYRVQADVWSMGVVFYELFHGEMLTLTPTLTPALTLTPTPTLTLTLTLTPTPTLTLTLILTLTLTLTL